MEGVTYVVYEEFLAYSDMEQKLSLLAEYPGTALCPAVQPDQPLGPELESMLRSAARMGIPVNAWLLLPEEQGYWFNEENFAQASDYVYEFLDWIEQRHIPLEWIMFDMEMSVDKIRAMREGGLFEVVIPTLKENVDPEQYERSTQAYAELVRKVQERGYRVTAAAYPMVLDDLRDDDFEIQDAFNTPIVGVAFDEIYFMVYRSTFVQLLGITPGPDLVYQYALEARQHFGEAGVIALGIVGTIGMVSEEGYTEPAQLAVDIAAARAGGSARVYIFSLDGMLATGALDAWMILAGTPPRVPEPDDATEQAREIVGLLDNLF